MPEQPNQRPVGPAAPPDAPGGQPENRPRYRSLRELSGGTRRPVPGRPGTDLAAVGYPPPEVRRPDGTGHPRPGQPWAPQPPQPRRSPVRYTVLGALVMLLLVGLVWGGYAAYREFAPYYGLGYTAGRSGTVKDVTFTVASAKCGLSEAPTGSAKPVKGQFCVVEVQAHNAADQVRYLSLSMFSVELDSGSRANPARTAMVSLSTKLAPGERRTLQLVYDVWDGIRMDTLKVQIGYETTNIPLL